MEGTGISIVPKGGDAVHGPDSPTDRVVVIAYQHGNFGRVHLGHPSRGKNGCAAVLPIVELRNGKVGHILRSGYQQPGRKIWWGQGTIPLESMSKHRIMPVGQAVSQGERVGCIRMAHVERFKNDQAQAALERSLEILRPLDEPRVLVEPVTFLGIVMALKGSSSGALELFGEGIEIAEQIGDRWFRALCLTEHIDISTLMGHPENAYERYQSAMASC